MKYMLDTNICIYLIRKKPVQVLLRLQKIPISEIGISAITLSEMEYGIQKSAHPAQNRLALNEFLASLEIAPYLENAAAKYGEIRSLLEKQGKTIGPLDMLIAAHALAIDAILVTNNVKEFKRVSGLTVENWV